MTDDPAPQDPAEVLKNFSSLQMPDEQPRFVMGEKNRKQLEKLNQRVRQLRGGK